MTPDVFLSTILNPGLAWCAELPGWRIPSDERAAVLMLAIAGQESGWEARIQQGNGPAHGFWQMERAGGVRGVLQHPATFRLATSACVKSGILAEATNAWGMMATAIGDHLAVAFARLLLWTDAKPLPALGDAARAWDYYARNWRPGRPRPDDWQSNYQAAIDAVKAGN